MICYLILIKLVLKVLLVQIINILVKSTNFQTIQQLLLNGSLDLRGFKRGSFPIGLSLLVLFIDSDQSFLSVTVGDLELSLPNDHLMELGQPLLAFMALELTPELKGLIYNLECILVISGELNFFPELIWQMGAFNRLHVQVALTFFL